MTLLFSLGFRAGGGGATVIGAALVMDGSSNNGCEPPCCLTRKSSASRFSSGLTMLEGDGILRQSLLLGVNHVGEGWAWKTGDQLEIKALP